MAIGRSPGGAAFTIFLGISSNRLSPLILSVYPAYLTILNHVINFFNMKGITADQLNAFVTPSVEVMEKLARISTAVGTLRKQRCIIPPDTLLVLIGVEGDLNGEIVFQFDTPILKEILTSLLGETPSSLIDPICLDAMGEVANIIAGNATGKLEGLGLRTTITPPRVLIGRDLSGPLKNRIDEKEVVVIPLHSAHGEIGISIFLEKE